VSTLQLQSTAACPPLRSPYPAEYRYRVPLQSTPYRVPYRVPPPSTATEYPTEYPHRVPLQSTLPSTPTEYPLSEYPAAWGCSSRIVHSGIGGIKATQAVIDLCGPTHPRTILVSTESTLRRYLKHRAGVLGVPPLTRAPREY
jgi:hypothetical protein